MKKFEYNSLIFDNKADFPGLLDLKGIEWRDGILSPKELYIHKNINDLGTEGWELVSVVKNGEETTFYFKKEIN